MSRDTSIKKMINELEDVASRHSGEKVQVKILSRDLAKHIQIIIPNQTFLDIKFQSIITSEGCDL